MLTTYGQRHDIGGVPFLVEVEHRLPQPRFIQGLPIPCRELIVGTLWIREALV